MLTLVLASFLAAPPVGEPWSVVLRPAVVVKVEEPATDSPEAEEPQASPDRETPRLAPARTVPSKAKAKPRAPRKR